MILYLFLLNKAYKKIKIQKNKNILFFLRELIRVCQKIFFYPFSGKILFYNLKLEINMFMIFCSEKQRVFFDENITCYKGIYIFYSYASIISMFSLFYQGFIFTSFYFKKVENTNFEIVKFLVVNTQKSFFYVKAVSVILGGIDTIYSFNNYSIFILFLMSFYNSYNSLIELKYLDQDKNSFQFLYYYHFIYFFTTFLCCIGFLLNCSSYKGLFYVLFIIIFLYIIYVLIYNNNENIILSYKYLVENIRNDLILFLQARYLTHAVEKRKISRDVLYNLLSYFSQLELNNEDFHFDINYLKWIKTEENIDLELYKSIDKFYKIALHYNPFSLLLKVSYSNFLRQKLKKNTKAYIILNQIIDNENDLNFEQDFYCYRLKRKIEDRFIETGIDNSEISYKYQCNCLINLISKVSLVYLDFWNLLLTNKSDDNIFRLNEFGNEINKILEEIEYKYNCILKMKIKNNKIILLYGYYLRDIINDIEKANKILTDDFISEVNNDNNIEETLTLEYGIDSIPSTSINYIIISAKKDQACVIKKISTEVCKNLGYTYQNLIDQNFNILLPDLLKDEHDKLINNKIKNFDYNENNTNLLHKSVYFTNKSKNIVNMGIEIRNGYDEDLNPFFLCKITFLNDSFEIKNNFTNFHFITNTNYIIQYYSTNCYNEFSFQNRMINNNLDILKNIIEFNQIYLKKVFGVNKREKRDKIKYYILKELYLSDVYKEIVTWKLNNKQYFMKCKELKINKKLLGYVFTFKKSNYDDKLITPIQHEKAKTPIIIKKKKNSFSNNFFNFKSYSIQSDNKTEEFNIDNNYIPDSIKSIEFNEKKKEYFFFNKNEGFEKLNEFLKNEIFNQEKNNNKNKKNNSTEETEEEESEVEQNKSKSFSSISSSTDSNKNINVDTIDKNNLIKTTVTLKNIRLKENVYQVNFKNIHFLFYDFNKNFIQSLDYVKKGKVDEIFENEKRITFEIINKTYIKKEKKMNKNNAIIKLRTTNSELYNNEFYKLKEKKINQTIKDIKSYLKISKNMNIYLLDILLLLFIVISILLPFFFITKNLKTRIHLKETIKMFNYIYNIIEGSFYAVYYSFEMILLRNDKYTNFLETREKKIELSKNYLYKVYDNIISLSNTLLSINLNLNKKTLKKISNIKLTYSQFDDKGNNYNYTSFLLNSLYEYSYSIYQFTNKNESKINGIDIDYRFITYNSYLYNSSNLNELIKIFEKQYKNERNKTFIRLMILLYLYSFVSIVIFILGSIIIKKIHNEKEDYLKYFFKIDNNYIRYSIYKCKKYSTLNYQIKNNIKYLISTPLINFSNDDDNESENDSLITNVNFIEEKKTEKKKKNFKEKIIIRDRKRLKFFIFIIFIVFLIILVLLSLLLLTLKKNNFKIHLLNELIFYVIQKKNILIQYINYLRLYIGYSSGETNFAYLNEIDSNIHSTLNYVFKLNDYYTNKIYGKISKYGIPKNSSDTFQYIFGQSLCFLFEKFSSIYNYSCKDLGYNVADYGLNTVYIYYVHSISNLVIKFDQLNNYAISKGYKYNELFYGTEKYNQFLPDDENKIEEYQKINPFLIFNDDVMKNLNILNEEIVMPSYELLINRLNYDIVKLFNKNKNIIIIICIICVLIILILFSCYIYPILLFIKKDLKKIKKMILIIPREILYQIINQERKKDDNL